MRILQVNDNLERIGGAESHLYDLMDLLKEKGHEVDIWGGERPTKLSYITRFYNPSNYLRLSQKIKEFKPDIVHFHNISRGVSPSVLHAARRHNIAAIMTVHDWDQICPDGWFIYRDGKPCKYGFSSRCLISNCSRSSQHPKYRLYRLYNIFKLTLHRQIIRDNVDFLIAPSAILADWLKNNLKARSVRVIPNYIDASRIDCEPIEDTKRILYVGRLSKEKGIEYLVKAIPIILKEIPKAELVVVGAGFKKNLEGLVKSLDLSENVIFTGLIKGENLGKLYQDAEVVVIPSIWAENCPIVALEAMAYGKPLIASRLGGLPELVEDGETGYLFEPKNPDDLADKVMRILSDFELAREMSLNARKRAEESYSAEGYYQELIKIYQEAENNG